MSAATVSEGCREWTPSMVAPRLLNEAEVRRALERHYPPLLRDAGIGGTVGVLCWIDETGRVQRATIAQPSGYPALDAAALRVADLMRLLPALNRGDPVRVMVTVPITFSTIRRRARGDDRRRRRRRRRRFPRRPVARAAPPAAARYPGVRASSSKYARSVRDP